MTAALANDPLWLKAAFKDLGQFEIPGPRSNPRIIQMYAAAHYPVPDKLDDSEWAWCSAAQNAWVSEANLVPTYNLMARSWVRWGKPLDITKTLPRGAILIFRRGTSPTQGHVCTLLEDNGKTLRVIGGNQADSHGGAVTITTLRRAALVAARWPDTATNSATVHSFVGGGVGFTGGEGAGQAAEAVSSNADSISEFLGMATSTVEQYAYILSWAKWILIALAIASLFYGAWHYISQRLRPKPTPAELIAAAPIEETAPTIDDQLERDAQRVKRTKRKRKP